MASLSRRSFITSLTVLVLKETPITSSKSLRILNILIQGWHGSAGSCIYASFVSAALYRIEDREPSNKVPVFVCILIRFFCQVGDLYITNIIKSIFSKMKEVRLERKDNSLSNQVTIK
jgi:hypothetical protein